MTDLIEELQWRGMVHDVVPGTQQHMLKEMTTGYVGFDPTADSLHVGSLIPIMLLVHLQRHGHKPLALVGGATGMVGDPSGKSEERNLLDAFALEKNVNGVRIQLAKFLEFNDQPNSALLVNNYDWMKDFSFIEFIRDVGKNITVNYMMAKDSIKKRIETGISFTEFSYQLLQGYDFYYLNKELDCRLQMGGSDQWGNITTGTELIRKMGGKESFALTCPLMTKSDGGKFGKTEDGTIWLDADRTSPYKFYQFWLNTSDDDAGKYIRTFTLLAKEEIETIEKQHAEAPHERGLQKALAKDITCRVHSDKEYETAVKASQILFSKKVTDSLKTIDEKTLLSVFEGVPHIKVVKSNLQGVGSFADLLSTATNNEIFSSKGEAKRMIKQGGISINKLKLINGDDRPELEFLQEKFLLVQKGKKNYYIVEGQ
jgi:tyrosyl-tRNA synthetase